MRDEEVGTSIHSFVNSCPDRINRKQDTTDGCLERPCN